MSRALIDPWFADVFSLLASDIGRALHGDSSPPGREAPEGKQAGSGVICEARALPGAVIHETGEIYSASHWKCGADGLDSRFRGNDPCFERDPIPNDTCTN